MKKLATLLVLCSFVVALVAGCPTAANNAPAGNNAPAPACKDKCKDKK